MITKELIQQARSFAYAQANEYLTPPPLHLDLVVETAQVIAHETGGNANIVNVGTLLMDCQLGKAMTENKRLEHIHLSHTQAELILSKSAELTLEEKLNILSCIDQHHGADRFYSLEAEICCNADCYQFLSVKGFLGVLYFHPEFPFPEFIQLIKTKLSEKWAALTLDICKQELAPQYEIIKTLLDNYPQES